MSKKNFPKKIDQPSYSYWQALYMAFYSGRLYVDVAKYWRGFSFFYLLLLISVLSIPLCVRFSYQFNDFLTNQIISPLQNVPALMIQEGRLLFDKKMPYIINNQQSQQIGLIDTSKTVLDLSMNHPGLMIIISQDEFYFKAPAFDFLTMKSQKKTRSIISKMLDPIIVPFADLDSRTYFAGDLIQGSGLIWIKWLAPVLIYLFTVFFLFGIGLSYLFLVTTIAQAFSWLIFKFKLQFKQAYRLLIVASTAQISFFLICCTFDASYSAFLSTLIILMAVYFSFAVISVKRESRQMVLL